MSRKPVSKKYILERRDVRVQPHPLKVTFTHSRGELDLVKKAATATSGVKFDKNESALRGYPVLTAKDTSEVREYFLEYRIIVESSKYVSSGKIHSAPRSRMLTAPFYAGRP